MATTYNYRWASGVGADGEPQYASATVIEVGGRKVYNPKDVHCRLAGLFPVVEDPPSDPPPYGMHWEPRQCRIVDGVVHRMYEAEPDPTPAPRRFDPYDLMDALMEEGVWDTVKEWLQSSPEGWDRWSKTPYVEEGEPTFAEVVATVKKAFDWDDVKVEETLSKCVMEGD